MSEHGAKFIIVTGGVLSGLGKGIAAASVGRLLSSRLKVVPIKCDGYLNTDPGTMNPKEHGEVFVLDDGGEVDMDFGHYERFLGVNCKFSWNLTMGKIYKTILDRERLGDFLGQTVQLIPHVTDAIKAEFHRTAREEKADIVIIEIGGTVGDMENELYIESVRQLRQDMGPGGTVLIHLTYVPIPSGVQEQKSKPTQMSVKLLNERGLYPDIIIGRCAEPLSDQIKRKVGLFCNIEPKAVISGVDVAHVYEIPLHFEADGITELLHKKLGIYSPPQLEDWRRLVGNLKRTDGKTKLKLAMCGKYTTLHDSYASILEAVHHCCAHLDAEVELHWIETTDIEKGRLPAEKAVEGVDCVIVPGGFGGRGIEGKIEVIRVCREQRIPFLGICYGMQLAVVEYARNVCGITGANTTEIEAEKVKVPEPVVCILPEQQDVVYKGGTMRLGGHDVVVIPGTKAHDIFAANRIRRRFRHRFEVNPVYIERLTKAGMVFSGHAADKRIMQIMELPEHPFFMGSQFHPELTSKLEKPDEMFYHLIKTARDRKPAGK